MVSLCFAELITSLIGVQHIFNYYQIFKYFQKIPIRKIINHFYPLSPKETLRTLSPNSNIDTLTFLSHLLRLLSLAPPRLGALIRYHTNESYVSNDVR